MIKLGETFCKNEFGLRMAKLM